jgi:HEAT repeat protein
MIAARDCGLIPEALFADLAGDAPLYDYVHRGAFDVDRALQAAWTATISDPAQLPAIAELLNSQNPVLRYWAALGVNVLGTEARRAEPEVAKLLNDSHAAVRIAAACALARLGNVATAEAALLAEFDGDLYDSAAVQLLNALIYLGWEEKTPPTWIVAQLAKGDAANEYVRRFAERRHEVRP